MLCRSVKTALTLFWSLEFHCLQDGQVLWSEFQSGDGAEVSFDGVQNIEFGAEIGSVVGRTDEWPGSAVAEAFVEGDLFVFRKLIRVDVFDDWKMFRCWAEVLTEGQDGDVMFQEIVHRLEDFVVTFAKSKHDAGFGGDVAVDHVLGFFKDCQGALIFGT